MKKELFVQLKAGDFGLVVGRALAVYLWFVAAGTLFALLIISYRDRSYYEGARGLNYILTTGVLPALFHGVVGWGVWHGSARFAGSEGRAPSDDVVQVSGKLLFCGLLMGVATYPLVTGGLSVAMWLLAEGTSGQPTPFPVSATVHLILGSGLFAWAYVAASRVKIPELEYVTEATEATGGDGSD